MVSVNFLERLIGNKAHDSDRLDVRMNDVGVDMISLHRSNRKPENKTQDGRKLRRYKRRWTVERTIGRLQNYRLSCIRSEKSTAKLQGFVNPTCALLLMKEVWGQLPTTNAEPFQRKWFCASRHSVRVLILPSSSRGRSSA